MWTAILLVLACWVALSTTATPSFEVAHHPTPTWSVYQEFADLLREGLFTKAGCDCCLTNAQGEWVNNWAREQLNKIESLEARLLEARKVAQEAIHFRTGFEKAWYEEKAK